MNVQQKLVAAFVTAGIFILISVGLSYADKYISMDKELIKYLVAVMMLFAWFFFLFVSDLYMSFAKLEKQVDAYQKQFHSEVMKKYIDTDKK